MTDTAAEPTGRAVSDAPTGRVWTSATWLRAAGLVAWGALAVRAVQVPHGSGDAMSRAGGLSAVRDLLLAPSADVVASAIAFALMAFLWLGLTGALDRTTWRRSDAVVVLPLAVAAGIRLGLCPRSIQEIEIHLYDGALPTLHSLVVPLLGRMLRALPVDPYEAAFVLAGGMAAWAVVPLYRFVAARSGSAAAGALVALAYACHPVVARFAPTDAPYGLMLLCFFQALWWLDTGAVFAGAVSLAIAVSCRADGALLLPVAVLCLGPGVLWARCRADRAGMAAGAAVAIVVVAASLAVVIPAHDLSAGNLQNMLSIEPSTLLHDTLIGAGQAGQTPAERVARRVWQALALLGLVAGLADRRLRWAAAALPGALLLAAPYPSVSWIWPVGMHRLVPASAMLSLAAGAGLAWPVLVARSARWRAGMAPVLALVPLTLAVAALPFLTRPWSFNVEWEMVRTALAPGGVERRECNALTFGAKAWDDLDIHDFGQALFDTNAVNCWNHDCVAEARQPGCHRYVRGLHCFVAPEGASAACTAPGLTPGEALAGCLAPECAAVERALALRPIDERVIDPADTFGGTMVQRLFPTIAVVGVYDVVAPPAP